jgi:hypothetical protein
VARESLTRVGPRGTSRLYLGDMCRQSTGLRLEKCVLAKVCTVSLLSYPIFMPKSSTHRMHDPGSIVPHIRPKVFTDIQISRIKYNYYMSNVSKDYDDSHQSRTAEDSITPQEWQPGQHVA